MGYRIDYVDVPDRQRNPEDRGGRVRRMTALFLLLFCLSVRIFSEKGTDVLREFVLPGERTVTEEAVQTFVEHLRMGNGIGESLEVFCMEVLQDAAENLP